MLCLNDFIILYNLLKATVMFGEGWGGMGRDGRGEEGRDEEGWEG